MVNRRKLLGVVLAGAFTAAVALDARQSGSGAPLTEQDRAEIKDLSAKYGRALGLCLAEEYAALFAAPDGYFASGPRGQVTGHEKLIALVRSEPHCNDGSERHVRNIPASIELQASPDGVTSRATFGPRGGHYEDVYVKTAEGWRFKSRAYVSPQEEDAHLTSQDFIEIRQLAGNGSGHFQDVWLEAPGGKRFKSSGVVITPSPDGATGRAYLKGGAGRYDDVYVKTPQGWRFKSRVYSAEG